MNECTNKLSHICHSIGVLIHQPVVNWVISFKYILSYLNIQALILRTATCVTIYEQYLKTAGCGCHTIQNRNTTTKIQMQTKLDCADYYQTLSAQQPPTGEQAIVSTKYPRWTPYPQLCGINKLREFSGLADIPTCQ